MLLRDNYLANSISDNCNDRYAEVLAPSGLLHFPVVELRTAVAFTVHQVL